MAGVLAGVMANKLMNSQDSTGLGQQGKNVSQYQDMSQLPKSTFDPSGMISQPGQQAKLPQIGESSFQGPVQIADRSTFNDLAYNMAGSTNAGLLGQVLGGQDYQDRVRAYNNRARSY